MRYIFLSLLVPQFSNALDSALHSMGWTESLGFFIRSLAENN